MELIKEWIQWRTGNMIEISNGCYIIGFDNGYQFGKTANFMFDNGVFPLGKVEPL